MQVTIPSGDHLETQQDLEIKSFLSKQNQLMHDLVQSSKVLKSRDDCFNPSISSFSKDKETSPILS